MFDLIFDMVCEKEYHAMVLTSIDGILYAVPCEDSMSGYYPEHKKKVKLSNIKVTEFMNCKVDNENVDAVLFRKYKNELEIILVSDSWDGYQPLDD